MLVMISFLLFLYLKFFPDAMYFICSHFFIRLIGKSHNTFVDLIIQLENIFLIELLNLYF